MRQWTTESARGTSGYRAPEMLAGTKLVFNNKVDIWAFGCILHEAATGRKLFETDFAVVQRTQSNRWTTHQTSQLAGLSTHASNALTKTILFATEMEAALRPRATELQCWLERTYDFQGPPSGQPQLRKKRCTPCSQRIFVVTPT